MGFLNPWLLLGTLGVAVPIIIHLLNRFRHRQVEWGAMELLKRALVVRSRQVQLEDLILLALRCLAVLLLALALARPTISASNWMGKNAQAGIVIALDGSFSMNHRPAVASRFENALTEVRQILKTVNPGDPVSLILMGNRPRILMRTVGYDEERFDQALKKLAPLSEGLSLDQDLEQTANIFRDTIASARECYIISDSQALTWDKLSDKTRRAIQEMTEKGKVYYINVGTDNDDNLAITRFDLASGSLRKGNLARYQAEVRNFGKAAAHGVSVKLMVGDTTVDQKLIEEIKPGEPAVVPLMVRFDKAGSYKLSARIGQDALSTDNVRYAAAIVRDQVKILCVDGRPGKEPFQTATGFLSTALMPKRGTPGRDSLQVRVVSWLELASQRLSDFDAVMFVDVPNVRPEDVTSLATYVQQGGNLVVFAGANTSAEVMNKRLVYQDSNGKAAALLPAELTTVQKFDTQNPAGWPMEIASGDHPIVRTIARLPKQLLDEARFGQFYKSNLLPGSQCLLKIAGVDTSLLCERKLGQGRVLLFTSSADRSWTNFIINPAGPMLMHEAVSYLTGHPFDRPLIVGEALSLTLPKDTNLTSLVFREPSGKESAVQVTEKDGRRQAEIAGTDAVGFYEVMPDANTVLPAAVNIPANESDVRCKSAAEMSVPLAGIPVKILDQGADIAAVVKEGRVGRELWRYLMALGLVVLAIEMFLARKFSQRMNAGESASAADKREEMLSRGKAA